MLLPIHSVFLSEFLESGKESDGSVPPLEFEQLPFNHPLYIMYSSGTTGAPKCMVHSAGVRYNFQIVVICICIWEFLMQDGDILCSERVKGTGHYW